MVIVSSTTTWLPRPSGPLPPSLVYLARLVHLVSGFAPDLVPPVELLPMPTTDVRFNPSPNEDSRNPNAKSTYVIPIQPFYRFATFVNTGCLVVTSRSDKMSKTNFPNNAPLVGAARPRSGSCGCPEPLRQHSSPICEIPAVR
ncbi:hypothetical protein BKA70DRAFT_814049 [Coprinopsis sp. MPI-PUGE-AT-0042]|nr:hypothetical protein BKA70DRAFT_814049 [Coprinopsis sp. MPI-PUGE-AT-0042]